MSAATNAPALLLGACSLELPSRTTRDRALEVAGRFREPESLAVTLVKALDAGAEGVYSGPSATLRAALAELRRPVPVLARLPHTPPAEDLFDEPWLTREPHEDAGGWGGMRASLVGLAMPAAMFKGDLAARIATRLELERDALGAREVRGLAIAAPLTDLALAAGHAKFFERILKFGRSRFAGSCGFETRNLAALLTRLREWGIAPDFVIGPFNSRGFGMAPDAAAVRAAVAASEVPVIAAELRAGGTVPLLEGATHAHAHGAKGLLPELVDLDEVAGELRTLASLSPR